MSVTVSSALLAAANAAASAAADGAKNAAFCGAISAGIGSDFRLVARRDGVVVLDVRLPGALTVSSAGLDVPTQYNALYTLSAADIDTGAWTLRIEKFSDASVYLTGSLGRSGTDFLLSDDLDPDKGFAIAGLTLRSPSLDTADWIDVLVNDMKLFHDGPSDVLSVIPGWGSGALLPESYARPSGWTDGLFWFHVMEDTSSLSATDAARAWRVAGPYTGNQAPNTRIQARDLQLWYLDAGNVWRLHGHSVQPGRYMPPIQWGDNDYQQAKDNATWRDETSNGGGASVRDIGRGDYESHVWHSFTSPKTLPTFGGLASCFFARRILDNGAGTDDRASCRILGACAGDYYIDAATSAGGPKLVGKTLSPMGYSRLKYMTNDWQMFAFYTTHLLSEAQIRANPPPFIGV